jgi:hypothetical protein
MLLLDFMLLWLAVLLLYVPRHIHQFPEAQPPLRYDFTLKPRSWNDELKFQVLQYSSRVILVVVMVIGLVHTDLLSAGYLIFSLALLYHGGTRSPQPQPGAERRLCGVCSRGSLYQVHSCSSRTRGGGG